MPSRLNFEERQQRRNEQANSPRGRVITFLMHDGEVKYMAVNVKPTGTVEVNFPSATLDPRDVSSPMGTAKQADEAFQTTKDVLTEFKIPFEESVKTQDVERMREPGPREDSAASYRSGDREVQDYTTPKTVRTVTFKFKDLESYLPPMQTRSLSSRG